MNMENPDLAFRASRSRCRGLSPVRIMLGLSLVFSIVIGSLAAGSREIYREKLLAASWISPAP
ncbi:hypothetical protein ACEUZ9_002837 [Paracoccus litorisediminis]|uniref:hypothetical protein n=1 Tax=Paracoccus litorisediminis TaxID=2006130 RepID=UPI00372EA9CC